MGKEYKFEGETFELDDSNGCYIEVSYKGLVGYVGVYLQGTAEQPYCWWAENATFVTADGLTNGNATGADIESNLRDLCRTLLRKHREAEGRKAFKPEEACESLHDFVKSLTE